MKIYLFGKGFQSFEFENKYYRNLPGHGILFGLTSLDEKDHNGPKGIVGKFDYNCQDERLSDPFHSFHTYFNKRDKIEHKIFFMEETCKT